MTSSFFALHRLQQVINSLCNLLIMNSAKKCHKTLQYTAPRNDFCSLQKPYLMNIVRYGFFIWIIITLHLQERERLSFLIRCSTLNPYLLPLCAVVTSTWRLWLSFIELEKLYKNQKHQRQRTSQPFSFSAPLAQFSGLLPDFQFYFR